MDVLVASDSQGFTPPDTPSWPADFSTHPQMQAESFQVEALLVPAVDNESANEPHSIGLIAQIDRLAVRPQSRAGNAQSAWRFDDVMRSRVSVDSTRMNQPVISGDASLNAIARFSETGRDSWVERVALGLGGVMQDSLWVRNDTLAIEMVVPMANDTTPCQREYEWTNVLSVSQSVKLKIAFDDCPQYRLIGPLVNWQQFSDSVSATLTTQSAKGNISSIPMSGFAWLQHGWGGLLAGQGAVLIDTLKIRLTDHQTLNISRSKRRSGRGPETVQATLRREGLPAAPIEIKWMDGQRELVSDSGAAYPSVISLQNPELGLALQVKLLNRLSEVDGLPGKHLHVPVQISGSHQGQGFLVFNSQLPDP